VIDSFRSGHMRRRHRCITCGLPTRRTVLRTGGLRVVLCSMCELPTPEERLLVAVFNVDSLPDLEAAVLRARQSHHEDLAEPAALDPEPATAGVQEVTMLVPDPAPVVLPRRRARFAQPPASVNLVTGRPRGAAVAELAEGELLEQVAVAVQVHQARSEPADEPQANILDRPLRAIGRVLEVLERPWRPRPAVRRRRASRFPHRALVARARWAIPVVAALPVFALEFQPWKWA